MYHLNMLNSHSLYVSPKHVKQSFNFIKGWGGGGVCFMINPVIQRKEVVKCDNK